MKILHNECLKKYTTIKIGGYAKKLFIPENLDDLINLINDIGNENYYILGGGSNHLINDKKEFDNVILLNSLDKRIDSLGNGKYYIGASNRLQIVINAINKDGFGGIEYLYSVPGLIGGAILMNAGRGKPYGVSISDYIESVTVYDNGQIKVLSKEECGFSYRESIFKHGRYIILGANFNFDKKTLEESKKLKDERLELCKSVQDMSGYSFGSVFKTNNWKIMWVIRLIHPGYKKGMKFSKKTSNWMINKGEGTFKQAINLINMVSTLHKIFKCSVEPEVIIWD